MRKAIRGALLGAGLAFAVLLGVPALDRASGPDRETQVLVFGVDGADWSVIDAGVAGGELPNLAALLEAGVRADLRPERAFLSPPIWTSIASGQRSARHGIVDSKADASVLRARRFWDVAEEAGWSVGLFGWPITWPPRPVDAFMVPGYMARGTETHPPELAFLKEMESTARAEQGMGPLRQAGYGIRSWRHGARLGTLAATAGFAVSQKLAPKPFLDRYAALRELQIRLHRDVFVHLRAKHRPRLAVFYTDVVDKVEHFFWKYHDPAGFDDVDPADVERYGGVVAGFYREVDVALGRALAGLPDDAVVLFVSDHGFHAGGNRRGMGVRLKIPELLRLVGLAGRVHPVKVSDNFYLEPVEGEEGGVADARARLGAARHTASGRLLFELREAPGGGVAFKIPDDLILDLKQADEVQVADYRGPLEAFTEPSLGGGTHSDRGVFALRCPSCRRGATIAPLRAEDVGPTLLTAMGLPVPEGLDGRRVGAAFAASAE